MSIVTIEGSVLLPNGVGPTSGKITVTLSTNTSDMMGNKVIGRKVFDIPDGGDLSNLSPAMTIEANDGLTPANTYYMVDYLLIDSKGASHAFRELWDVSGSGTQNIGDIDIIGSGQGVYPSLQDTDAYHANVSREIEDTPEKTSPAITDILVIEDSEALYVKKRVQINNLPTGSGGGAWTVYTTATKPSAVEAEANKPYIVKNVGEHAFGEIIYKREDDTYAYQIIFAPF